MLRAKMRQSSTFRRSISSPELDFRQPTCRLLGLFRGLRRVVQSPDAHFPVHEVGRQGQDPHDDKSCAEGDSERGGLQNGPVLEPLDQPGGVSTARDSDEQDGSGEEGGDGEHVDEQETPGVLEGEVHGKGGREIVQQVARKGEKTT